MNECFYDEKISNEDDFTAICMFTKKETQENELTVAFVDAIFMIIKMNAYINQIKKKKSYEHIMIIFKCFF